jgi:two-component sensor histidine kinase
LSEAARAAAPAPDPSDSFADVAPPILRGAVGVVWRSFRNDFGDAADRTEALAVLRDVAERARRALADAGAANEGDPRSRSALGQYLLDRLNDAVFEELARVPGPQPSALGWALTFGAVRRTLQPDWAEYFTSRLTGPGCHDLVVEVAHDLRSPLTSVLFLAETLQREQSGPVTDIQRRQLGLIYAAALGLSTVTSDIIELARGGDRLVDTEPAPFSISEIFESVRDIVHPIAEEKGLEMRLTLPESDHRLGQPLALSRVLLNLTTNALKFTDQGYVEIAAGAGPLDSVEFAVRDTGHGISQEALETLYQPFRRAASRDSGYCFSGTGLGLAICRRLVEAMGGTLEVKSGADWGTRFHFVLNLPRAHSL